MNIENTILDTIQLQVLRLAKLTGPYYSAEAELTIAVSSEGKLTVGWNVKGCRDGKYQHVMESASLIAALDELERRLGFAFAQAPQPHYLALAAPAPTAD